MSVAPTRARELKRKDSPDIPYIYGSRPPGRVN